MFLIQHSKSSAAHTGQIICTMPGNCRHGTRCVLRRESNHWVTSLSYAVVMVRRRTQSLGVSSVMGRVIQHYSPPGLLPPLICHTWVIDTSSDGRRQQTRPKVTISVWILDSTEFRIHYGFSLYQQWVICESHRFLPSLSAFSVIQKLCW